MLMPPRGTVPEDGNKSTSSLTRAPSGSERPAVAEKGAGFVAFRGARFTAAVLLLVLIGW